MNINKSVGVIGAGSFGFAVANLLAEKQQVLLYERNKETAAAIQRERKIRGFDMHPNIQIAESLEQIAVNCYLIFPAVPSQFFKSMIIDFSP